MIQFMWQSKDYMKVRRINHFSPAFIYPDLFVYSLTVGTIAVAAGIVVKFHMTTVRTFRDIES